MFSLKDESLEKKILHRSSHIYATTDTRFLKSDIQCRSLSGTHKNPYASWAKTKLNPRLLYKHVKHVSTSEVILQTRKCVLYFLHGPNNKQTWPIDWCFTLYILSISIMRGRTQH